MMMIRSRLNFCWNIKKSLSLPDAGNFCDLAHIQPSTHVFEKLAETRGKVSREILSIRRKSWARRVTNTYHGYFYASLRRSIARKEIESVVNENRRWNKMEMISNGAVSSERRKNSFYHWPLSSKWWVMGPRKVATYWTLFPIYF